MTSPNQIISETLRAQNTDCSLAVTLELASDALHLHYQVQNCGALPVYLLNKMWNTIERDAVTDAQVFVTLPNLATIQVDSTEVLISKSVIDVPYLMLVEVRQIPCMTRLAPGETYQETMRLTLPLMPYTVYERKASQGPTVSRNARFELGYIQSSPYIEQIIKPIATPTGTAFYIDAFPAKNQSIIGTGPFQEPVLVISQLDARPTKPTSTGEWTPWD